MIDIKEHTILILGVAISVLLISTVMVPILTATTDEMMAYRNNDEYVVMVDLFQHNVGQGLENGDVVSCTIQQDGHIHVDNTRNGSIAWEYYMPCPEVVFLWDDGAVINMGDSLGIVGFDLNNSRGYTNVKDANFTVHDAKHGISMTLVIAVWSTTWGNTTFFDIGDQAFIYIPAPEGDYAYYTLENGPVYFNPGKTMMGVSFGNDGTSVHYVRTYWDEFYRWGDEVIEIYPFTQQYGGTFSTEGNNPHTLTHIQETDVDTEYHATRSTIGPAVWAMNSIDIAYTGGTDPVELKTWVLAPVKYSGAPEDAETIQTLVAIIPLLMLVALIMPIAALYDRAGRKNEDDWKEER